MNGWGISDLIEVFYYVNGLLEVDSLRLQQPIINGVNISINIRVFY